MMKQRPGGFSTGTSTVSGAGAVLGIGMLVAAGFGLWALVCAAQMVTPALDLLMNAANGAALPDLAHALAFAAISGAFSGIGIAWMRMTWRSRSKTARGVVEAAAEEMLDDKAAGHLWISAAIGALIGALAAGAGVVGLLQVVDGSASTVVSNVAYPIHVLAGGGFGGPGGGDFWSLVFLALVVLVMLLAFGLLASVSIHLSALLVAGLAGVVKEGAKEKVLHWLEGDMEELRARSIFARGLLVGLSTGLLHGLLTAGEVAAQAEAPPKAAQSPPQPVIPPPVATPTDPPVEMCCGGQNCGALTSAQRKPFADNLCLNGAGTCVCGSGRTEIPVPCRWPTGDYRYELRLARVHLDHAHLDHEEPKDVDVCTSGVRDGYVCVSKSGSASAPQCAAISSLCGDTAPLIGGVPFRGDPFLVKVGDLTKTGLDLTVEDGEHHPIAQLQGAKHEGLHVIAECLGVMFPQLQQVRALDSGESVRAVTFHILPR